VTAPETPESDRRRATLRAIWQWDGGEQRDFAARAGLKYDRFRAAMRDPRVPPPSLDELLAAAAAAGVPDRFATHGWEPTLEQRVAELEELMRDTRLTLLARELPGSGRGRRPSRDRDNGVGDLAPGDPAEPS